MTLNHTPDHPEFKANSPVAIFSLVFTILIGSVIRLVHILPLDFPLNDGGAFYQMIIDLQNNNYALPVFTTYNLKQIPFSYPPLAFYLSGFLSDLIGGPVIEVLRVLPALISILTIPAFYLLSRSFLASERQSILATAGFAFLPTAFDWLIVGGGLTRSFGYLFAILTFWQVNALFTVGTRKNILFAGLFASLTILSHPGTAWFTLYCSAILMAFRFQENKKVFIKSLWVIVGVFTLTAPWWYMIITRHGTAVLTYPFQTESASLASFLTPFTFIFTNEPLVDILAVCGFFGVVICLYNRLYLLPIWLFSIFFFETRLGATYSVIPMALLIGIGIDQGAYPIIFPSFHKGNNKLVKILPKVIGAYLAIYILINAYLGINYQVVNQEEIASMQWIAANTPASSQFLVLSGNPQYGIDPVSEWFPTLSQRTSQTTPQVHEWLPNKEFNHRIKLHAELQETFLECAEPGLDCILTWAEQREVPFSHIYIPVSAPIYIPIESLSKFAVMLDDAGGLILARK